MNSLFIIDPRDNKMVIHIFGFHQLRCSGTFMPVTTDSESEGSFGN